jgi:transcriptional regulator with XRE-family HTH domain
MKIDPEVLKLARQKLGELLKDERQKSGISKSRVAEATGMQRHQIDAIEDGRTAYTIDTLFAYAHGIDCYLMVSVAPREGKHLDLDDMQSKM